MLVVVVVSEATGEECNPGFWNFPNCQQCECNGHADTCHDQTGVCNDCRDATMGDHCDKCIIGYFGRPEIGDAVNSQCHECECDPLGTDPDR